MNEKGFWAVIASTRPNDGGKELHLSRLRNHLRGLAPVEIASFQRHLDAAMANAQIRDLWSAAGLIKGWCTDDGFIYFCLWLIAQGEATYRAALENPDTLADVVNRAKSYNFEALWGVARTLYQKMTGEEMPDNDVKWPKELRGEWCDLEDDVETRRRFPQLFAKMRVRRRWR
jgi:hypothetical protein